MDRGRLIEVVRASFGVKIFGHYVCIVRTFFMFIENCMLLGTRRCWTSPIPLVRFGVLRI